MTQSSIDYLFQNIFEISQTLVTGGETQYELFNKVLSKAKAMHKKEVKNVTKSWVQRREQTRVISEHYGFVVGFEKGLDCYEDYYQELDKTDLDEEEFTKEYINNIFEETFNTK